jgi:predicted RNA-binding Zn ribbon-like protein
MTTLWTAHRFSGEVLALDVANTVVLRGDPARSFDRFASVDELGRFAAAATFFRSEEIGGNVLAVGDPAAAHPRIIALREATDQLFRETAIHGAPPGTSIAPLLLRCAEALARAPLTLAADRSGPAPGQGPVDLEAAIAVSALALLAPGMRRRIRICGNCRWLFIDRSRNGSRLWCDMSVCGNRQKAQRHYRRTNTNRREQADA